MKFKITPILCVMLALILSVKVDGQSEKTPSTTLQKAPDRKADAPPPPPVPDVQDEIFKVVEQMPRFPGCEDQNLEGSELDLCAKNKMMEYIGQHLVYPESAKRQGLEGVVVIQFVIGKDGSILEPKIVRDIGPIDCNDCDGSCGQATMKVFKKMQSELKWVAGKQRGKPIKVQYTMPVEFKL